MIPAEAVEAAASRLYPGWETSPADWKDYFRRKATEALEAAAPHMFAQALEDAVHAFPLETIHAPDNAVVWMMRRAEELRSER